MKNRDSGMKSPLKRKFRGVWIPKEIWLSKKLTPREKFFLVEIDSLDNSERGCFANNRHFMELFHVCKTTVVSVISSLIKKDLVISKVDHQGGNKRNLKVTPGILGACEEKQGGGLYQKTGIGYTGKLVEAIPENRYSPIPGIGTILIPIPIPPINNTNENNKDSFSDTQLALGLEEKIKRQAVGYELQMQAILPARNNGERTTYNRLRDHIIKLILAGKKTERVFAQVIAWARQARSITGNARAMWIGKCKEELGFRGTGEKLLRGRKHG